MSDAVIALDPLLKVAYFNASALDLLDMNVSILNHRIDKVFKLYSKDDKEVEVIDLIRSIKRPFKSSDFRIKYDNDDSFVNIQLVISPVHSGYGNDNSGFVMTIKDITLEKSINDERDEFISVVSHELRNPIAIAEGGLSNALYSIEKNKDIDELKNDIVQSHKQVLFLSDLINDLTNLARAENNKTIDSIDKINAKILIDEIVQEFSEKASAKGLEINKLIDPNLEVIHSSVLYIKEILQNFITNAIKYTESGTIEVSAKMIKDGINFSVADTGIGISKADSTKVFNKFFRSGDYRTSKSSGTGLGLYVATKLSKLLSGQITMSSTLNHGSTFTLFVPDKKPIKS